MQLVMILKLTLSPSQNSSKQIIKTDVEKRRGWPQMLCIRKVMSKVTFGFTCGEFSVALSGNDLVLPGSKNQPLKYSMIACSDPNDAAGIYTLKCKE